MQPWVYNSAHCNLLDLRAGKSAALVLSFTRCPDAFQAGSGFKDQGKNTQIRKKSSALSACGRYPWVQRKFGPLMVCRSGLLASIPLSLLIPTSSFAAASKLVRACCLSCVDVPACGSGGFRCPHRTARFHSPVLLRAVQPVCLHAARVVWGARAPQQRLATEPAAHCACTCMSGREKYQSWTSDVAGSAPSLNLPCVFLFSLQHCVPY